VRTAKNRLNSKRGPVSGSGPLCSYQPDLTQVYSDWNKKEKAASYPAWRPYPLASGPNKYEFSLRHG
jgi:hypothetical protein